MFFYTLTVIVIYQKVTYSLNIEKHLSLHHFIMGTCASWSLSVLFAAIPFMTEKRYNRVGSCLPFYESHKLGFRYVIFYTVVVGTCNIANATLAGLLLHSFTNKNKVGSSSGQRDQQIANENSVIKRMIIGHTVYQTIFNVAIVAFLVMSCIGGPIGKRGREWFTRCVVLQALLSPVVGSLRKKGFYRDTLRLLQRWNFYDWDKRRITIVSQRRQRSGSSGI